MKLPEIYKKRDETEKPIPAFVFKRIGFNYIWNVVDPVDGKWIATIQTINDKGVILRGNAEDLINSAGFSTDWAVWGDNGSFRRLKSNKE